MKNIGFPFHLSSTATHRLIETVIQNIIANKMIFNALSIEKFLIAHLTLQYSEHNFD